MQERSLEPTDWELEIVFNQKIERLSLVIMALRGKMICVCIESSECEGYPEERFIYEKAIRDMEGHDFDPDYAVDVRKARNVEVYRKYNLKGKLIQGVYYVNPMDCLAWFVDRNFSTSFRFRAFLDEQCTRFHKNLGCPPKKTAEISRILVEEPAHGWLTEANKALTAGNFLSQAECNPNLSEWKGKDLELGLS